MNHQLPQYAGWDAEMCIPCSELIADQQHAGIPGSNRDLADMKGLPPLTEGMRLTAPGPTRVDEEFAGPLQSVRVGTGRLVRVEALAARRPGLQPVTRHLA